MLIGIDVLPRKRRDDKIFELALRQQSSALVRDSMARTLAGLGQLKVSHQHSAITKSYAPLWAYCNALHLMAICWTLGL